MVQGLSHSSKMTPLGKLMSLILSSIALVFAASTALLACTSRWKDTFSQRTVGMGLRRLSALMVIGCSLFSVVCVCGQLSTCAVCCVRSRDD